jgi:KDO2-lipid IV(A) lauroyltransferase
VPRRDPPNPWDPPRDWAEFLAVRLLVEFAAALPLQQAICLGQTVTSLLARAVPKLRTTAAANLRLAGYAEPQIPVLIRGVFDSLGRTLAVAARLRHLDAANVGRLIEYEGFEHYAEAKRRGKGILFATAHLGNWELSALAHSLLTEPMHVVVRPLDNPLLDAWVTRLRERTGNSIHPKRDAIRPLLRALSRNQPVGILVDQNVLKADGIFINFFGNPACTQAAFARLAHRTGAAVIPGFAVWDDARQKYVLRFEPILEITGDVREDTQRVQAAVERAIRRNPDQWLWIHRRWKTQP